MNHDVGEHASALETSPPTNDPSHHVKTRRDGPCTHCLPSRRGCCCCKRGKEAKETFSMHAESCERNVQSSRQNWWEISAGCTLSHTKNCGHCLEKHIDSPMQNRRHHRETRIGHLYAVSCAESVRPCVSAKRPDVVIFAFCREYR